MVYVSGDDGRAVRCDEGGGMTTLAECGRIASLASVARSSLRHLNLSVSRSHANHLDHCFVCMRMTLYYCPGCAFVSNLELIQ